MNRILRIVCLFAAAAIATPPQPACGQGPPPADEYIKRVKNTSFVAPWGERVLRHEVTVNAGLEDVWKAWTTSEGLMSFMAPVVHVELKTGGVFDSNYRVGSKLGDPGTIHNQVLNYVPMEMFSIKVNLTQQFPPRPRDAGTLFAVITFQEAGRKKVLVAVSMLGWGEGEDWNQVYEHFNWGNAFTLGQLARRFEKGPVDWSKKSPAATVPGGNNKGEER